MSLADLQSAHTNTRREVRLSLALFVAMVGMAFWSKSLMGDLMPTGTDAGLLGWLVEYSPYFWLVMAIVQFGRFLIHARVMRDIRGEICKSGPNR